MVVYNLAQVVPIAKFPRPAERFSSSYSIAINVKTFGGAVIQYMPVCIVVFDDLTRGCMPHCGEHRHFRHNRRLWLSS